MAHLCLSCSANLRLVQIPRLQFGPHVLQTDAGDNVQRIDHVPQALAHLATIFVTDEGVQVDLSAEFTATQRPSYIGSWATGHPKGRENMKRMTTTEDWVHLLPGTPL